MKKRALQSRIMRVIALPMRVLSKARDMYVNSMNNYADRAASCEVAAWGPTGDPLPRSFSTNSMRPSEEADRDLRELVRLASKTGVPRSASVCMATIDEDEACEFGGHHDWDLRTMKSTFGAGSGILFPRGRTCASASTRTTAF